MRTYIVTFSKSESTTILKADNKKEASKLGNLHKRINNYNGKIEISVL